MRSNHSQLAATLLLTFVLVAACGGQEPEAGGVRAMTGTPSVSGPPSPPAATPDAPEPQATETTEETATMDIRLAFGEAELHGTLDDTPAGRDFAAMLPLTLTLTDFHDTEKISDLPRRVSTEDEIPAGTAGSAGDITVYAPWGNLALFYRDFTYTDDLIRLGGLEPGAAEILAGIQDGTTVTIEAAG